MYFICKIWSWQLLRQCWTLDMLPPERQNQDCGCGLHRSWAALARDWLHRLHLVLRLSAGHRMITPWNGNEC